MDFWKDYKILLSNENMLIFIAPQDLLKFMIFLRGMKYWKYNLNLKYCSIHEFGIQFYVKFQLF